MAVLLVNTWSLLEHLSVFSVITGSILTVPSEIELLDSRTSAALAGAASSFTASRSWNAPPCASAHTKHTSLAPLYWNMAAYWP